MRPEIHDVEGMDVRDADTGERIGFILHVEKHEWLVIAILPKDGGNQFIGSYRKPKWAVRALLENERDLERYAETVARELDLDKLTQKGIDEIADSTGVHL